MSRMLSREGRERLRTAGEQHRIDALGPSTRKARMA